MTQNLRQIRSRIRSVENTRKITRAMEMVSSAKLHRVKALHIPTRAYLHSIEEVLKGCVTEETLSTHPLLAKKESPEKITLLVIASDTGLCGVYNHNLISAAEDFIRKNDRKVFRIMAVGREAFNHFARAGANVTGSYLGLYGRFSPGMCEEICGDLTYAYETNEADEVYIAYTRFSPRLRHVATIEKFLSIEWPGMPRTEYLYEPEREVILRSVIQRYLSVKIRGILLEAFTAEHSSRMFAMKTATDNADELIDTLTLLRNKARQAAITREVLEIALSAEALKG